MPRARLSSLITVILAALLAGDGAGARQAHRSGSDAEAARRQAEAADQARSAGLTAQREATTRAEAAATDARRLAGQRVAAAAKLREAELAALDAHGRMAALTRNRQEAEQRLRTRAAELAPLLPVIERLSLYPAETLLAVGTDPDVALRGVLVLQGVGRTLEQQARALRAERTELDAAARAVEAEAPKLAAAEAAQTTQAAALDRQIEAARERERAANDEAAEFARRAAAEAARAETLRALIAAIDAQNRAARAQAGAAAERAERQRRPAEALDARRRQAALAAPVEGGLSAGQAPRALTAPVAGTVLRGWGEATDAGPATGVSYRALPGARVIAPCAGRAVFAAPFRSFGRLLIVDCGGPYHVVLAGLDRLDVQAGAVLQAGEPVGVMPDSRPVLYVELRRQGRAVDPAPLLRARS